MDSQSRVLVIAIVVVSLGFVALWFRPTVMERLAPEPVGAWVAIEIEDSGVADIGPVRIQAGQSFRLHAVLEAVGRDGEPIYYTRAPGLRFVSGPDTTDAVDAEGAPAPRDVAATSVRVWDRAPLIKVRWFTVEGPRPYLALTTDQSLDDFKLESFFQVDWAATWTVPGEIEGGFANHLNADARTNDLRRDFGTQHYQVRIELYGDEKSTLPAMRLASPDADALRQSPQTFSSVVATLPGALAGPSRVFGLTQLEMPADAPAAEHAMLRSLAQSGLAFSRLTVLRDQLPTRVRDSGAGGAAVWETIDLGAEPRWDETVTAGDLLRVGERVVVLFQDRGDLGRLDYEDLCFDYVRGPAVRALGDVFSGEGLVVEHHRVLG